MHISLWNYCQVRSGQVRSECLTCTFRASCCSACLSRAQVPAFDGSSVRVRKKKRGGGGSKGGPPALAGASLGSTNSPTGIGSRRRVIIVLIKDKSLIKCDLRFIFISVLFAQ